jgi:hypothetical protein
MVVIGGYNSSNTANLARMCAASRLTFHISNPECLVSPREIRHRPVGVKTEVTTTGWLPAAGEVRIGLTSGASTPDNLVAEVIRVLRTRHQTVVEEVRVVEEDVRFSLPRELRGSGSHETRQSEATASHGLQPPASEAGGVRL